MKKTFKCKNGHKFKSNEEAPLCPTCNEKSEQVKWNKVEPQKKESKQRKGLLNTIVDTTITAGAFIGLDGASSSKTENNSDSDFEGSGGKSGGGGASGTY